MSDVRSKTGTPILDDFNSSSGTPIVVNQTTGDAYVLLSSNSISGVNTTGNAATATTATTATTVSTTVASGATGTTQSVGDNSTKIATTEFVQSALPSRRNLVINGAFDIAQRNTTYALTTSFAYGCVDRWGFHQATTASCTASQVAIATSGIPFRYGLKLQRTAAATTTGVISATTAFETTDSVKFAGKQVTLSFYAKAGANYSAASSILNFAVITGTGTDQANAADPSGSWTGAATPLSVAQVITTTLTKYTVTGTLAAGATQIAVRAYWTPVGTAGADDSVTITGVQLEVGASATDFEFRSIHQELALCQRYYETSWGLGESASGIQGLVKITGLASASAQHSLSTVFKVQKRSTPTMTYYDSAGTSGVLTTFDSGGAPTNGATVALSEVGMSKVTTYPNNAAICGFGYSYTANAEL